MIRPDLYFDLQLNGYAGVDFNADGLDVERVANACRRLKCEGVAGALATVITDDVNAMCRRLSNIRLVREQDPLIAEVLFGVHIEGPFINELDGYAGAHPKSAIRPADLDIMKRLLEECGGLARIVTLAPERDPQVRVTRLLADKGICVLAGHCDPSLSQLQAAIDAGLSMFTHLGNGCPLMMHRHDNVIQRVLSLSDQLKLQEIFGRLRANAKKAFKNSPYSVTDKTDVALSGDKHDYVSYARYWWPNPDKPVAYPTSAEMAKPTAICWPRAIESPSAICTTTSKHSLWPGTFWNRQNIASARPNLQLGGLMLGQLRFEAAGSMQLERDFTQATN